MKFTLFFSSIEHCRTYTFNEAHRDAISCIDWNKGILATGSWDATVKIWQCNEINLVNLNQDLLAQLDHDSHVSALALCPDNSQLVSGNFFSSNQLIVFFVKKTSSISNLLFIILQ